MTAITEGFETAPAISPVRMIRPVTVVSGGPLALAVAAVLAPFAAARHWPDHLPEGGARRTAWWATAAALAAPWAYGLAVRPWLNRWGSTSEERRHRYPGDGHERPLVSATRAVTVHAPAREVWQWLVQIGQDRGGFYSYDWLENLAGCQIHSADTIRPELQDLAAGDELTIFPGVSTRIAELDPHRSLVIENWGAYIVDPIDEHSCRLIARSHKDRTPGGLVYLLTMELPHGVMERKTLLGIKQRAEAATRA
ncbi:MAG TPA: hypothetical protein VK204_16430 [Nocardioidaceae bacterium]|nr:hypothetical protein [Nocardioidaceae bacterium]